MQTIHQRQSSAFPFTSRKVFAPFAVLFAGVCFAAFCVADQPAGTSSAAASPRQVYSGRVVLLKEALERRGIDVAPEMADQAVLETDGGELVPILADWRGRAFFQDERLRNRKVELVASRRSDLAWLQVLMVFTFDPEGERQYTDYWCDVCSIPMYEIQPCECCQGEIRLRFQKRGLPEYLQSDE